METGASLYFTNSTQSCSALDRAVIICVETPVSQNLGPQDENGKQWDRIRSKHSDLSRCITTAQEIVCWAPPIPGGVGRAGPTPGPTVSTGMGRRAPQLKNPTMDKAASPLFAPFFTPIIILVDAGQSAALGFDLHVYFK